MILVPSTDPLENIQSVEADAARGQGSGEECED